MFYTAQDSGSCHEPQTTSGRVRSPSTTRTSFAADHDAASCIFVHQRYVSWWPFAAAGLRTAAVAPLGPFCPRPRTRTSGNRSSTKSVGYPWFAARGTGPSPRPTRQAVLGLSCTRNWPDHRDRTSDPEMKSQRVPVILDSATYQVMEDGEIVFGDTPYADTYYALQTSD